MKKVGTEIRLGASRGFSLLELLVVIGIILLLAGLAIPAISGVQGSMQLTKGAALVREHLSLARQMAISRNEPVFFSLCRQPDELGRPSYNTVVLTRFARDGSEEILGRAMPLPLGIGLSEITTWSSFLELPETSLELPAKGTVSRRQIRFEPSGSTSLSASTNLFLTLRQYRQPEDLQVDPEANFITLAIDPVTGRTFFYQP